VAVRRRHGPIGKRHQSARLEPGRAHFQADQRHAETARGGVVDEPQVVELGADMRLGLVDAAARKPGAPGFERAADQPCARNFGRGAKAVEGAKFIEEARAAGGHHFFFEQQPVFAIGVRTGAVAHFEVGLLGRDVEQRNRHLQHQFDVRIDVAEQLEPRHEELAAEGGRDGDAQARRMRCCISERRGLQRRKAGAHVGEISGTVGRKAEIAAAEELEAHVRFELADAVADRAGRDAQFIGRAARVAQPGHGFEGEQALDRGDVLEGHVLLPSEILFLALLFLALLFRACAQATGYSPPRMSPVGGSAP
jgi:hypothetical protein